MFEYLFPKKVFKRGELAAYFHLTWFLCNFVAQIFLLLHLWLKSFYCLFVYLNQDIFLSHPIGWCHHVLLCESHDPQVRLYGWFVLLFVKQKWIIVFSKFEFQG